jgi:hypothetical protein
LTQQVTHSKQVMEMMISSSLVRFGLKFDYILHHIQNFKRRRMLNVK